MAFRTFPAGQRHPLFASKTVEALRFIPNIFQGLLPDIFKWKARDTGGIRTGEDLSDGIHGQVICAPTLHAWLGAFLEVIGKDVNDLHATRQALFFGQSQRQSALHLLPRRKQSFSVKESPAIKLHTRQFETMGTERFRQGNHGVESLDIAPMEDNIETKRQACLFNGSGSGYFMVVCPGAGNGIAEYLIVGLKTDLD
jgi:hypothetical protein